MRFSFIKVVGLSFLVYFLSWFLVYLVGVNSLAIQSEDTLPAVFLPVSIIKGEGLYLDKYYDMLLDRYPHPDDKDYQRGLTPFYLRKVGSHYVSAFPIMTGILAVPVYFFPVIFNMSITWEHLIFLSHISSALIVALSGGFFYLLLKRRFSRNEKQAIALSAVYLFGTVNFALISQALWQHGALQLFVILGLYFLLGCSREGTGKAANKAARKRDFKNLFLSGMFFGFAVLSRPTAGLVLAVIPALVFHKNLMVLAKRGLQVALGLAVPVLFFFWYNKSFYLSVANQGYSNQLLISWLSPFPEGFLGTWVSPSKGILVYSPVLVFSLVGLFLVMKSLVPSVKKISQENLGYLAFGVVVILHTLILSLWKHWYGGWSFGYRMSSDVIPLLVLLIIPFLDSSLFQKYKKLFFGLLIFSVLVQIFGMIFFDGIWHAAYDLGFEDTSWLWSIKDSELLFNIRRVLVKVGLLRQACPKCSPLL
jgi:hypothetical protein